MKTDLRYPVYILSKGRAKSRHTSKALDKIGVPYEVVIEEQEYDDYAAQIDPKKIRVLPFSNLGSATPVRNWILDDARERGTGRHWIMDDNIRGFYRLNRNLKTPVTTGAIFRAAEDFVDRYENVAMAGLNSMQFALRRSGRIRPFYRNLRVYSCYLLDNNVPFHYRGKANQDTDMVIRLLKEGYCTVLFNAFLMQKLPTMSLKGGCTDIHKNNGRRDMAEWLAEMHPDVAKVSFRWGRPQHVVNYRLFKNNPFIFKDPSIKYSPEPNEYGMVLEELDESVNEWKPRPIEKPYKNYFTTSKETNNELLEETA